MNKIFTFLGLILLPVIAFAQYQNVRIDNYSSANEPSIWINPKNPLEIMAGTNLNYWYYSEDGGYTWESNVLESPQYGVWGDPVIMTDTAGDFYFYHLSNPPIGNWIDRIVCQKFDKGSRQWSSGTYMGLNGTKAQDKQWAVVDPATNTIYVTWTQFDDYGVSDPACQSNIRFSKSVDAGQSWTPAITISQVAGNCVDSGETTEGAVPAVGPNGEIYVSWSGPEGIVFDRSLDGGETWLDEDIAVDPHIGGWDFDIPGISRSNGMPVTKCDLGNSVHRGTIYINFADQRNGADDTDIWLTKSTDQGETWTEPVRVNDDEPGKQQFFTWMDIDQTNGHLYFVFYDRRAYDDNQTDVYMAVSGDGGETFTNTKISESPFIPWNNVFFGDYNNISAHNNTVRPIWTRMEGGARSIYTAIVDMTVGLTEAPKIPLSLAQNYPNPFKQSTLISFKLRDAGKVDFRVYDQTGRVVANPMQAEYHERGKHEYHFDAEQWQLVPGVYYYEISSNNQAMHRKMIIANN
ncbi:MAG: T9SS type A sorting domain-containing protein [Bacteroidales bacterium]|nr:T9SS type A sorting domain-containing protein [Bacteroidales bacterium]